MAESAAGALPRLGAAVAAVAVAALGCAAGQHGGGGWRSVVYSRCQTESVGVDCHGPKAAQVGGSKRLP